MNEIDHYQIPKPSKAEITGFNKSDIAIALRETSNSITSLFEEHGDLKPEHEAVKTHEVGDKWATTVERTTGPYAENIAYTVRYLEKVVPRQPVDTGEAGYDPYDVMPVEVTWSLSQYGDPQKQTHNFDGPHAPEREARTENGVLVEGNTTTGTIIVRNYGEDRLFGTLEGDDALEAIKDIQTVIAKSLERGDLTLRDERIPDEEYGGATVEQEPPQPAGRLIRLRNIGRGLLDKIK